MNRILKSFVTVSLSLFPLFCLNAASGSEIRDLRSFAAQDKTRVVLDIQGKPEWSSAQLKSGKTVIRIKKPASPDKSPSALAAGRGSCVSGVTKVREGADVRYIFDSEKCGASRVFLLEPQGGNAYWRVVADFAHGRGAGGAAAAAAGAAGAKASGAKTAGAKPSGTKGSGNEKSVNQREQELLAGTKASGSAKAAAASGKKSAAGAGGRSIEQMERELFENYSTVGTDGLRSMSPANAAAYEKKLEELRARHRKEQAELAAAVAAEAAKSSKTAGTAASKAGKNTKTTAAAGTGKAAGGKAAAKNTAAKTSSGVAARSLPGPVRAPAPFIIAVDAGHGGKDPGAIGRQGVKEKKVTLAIASHLARYINSDKRFRSVLIRSRDVFVDLDRRSEIARKNKADLLISIHADSVASGASSARGVSVWVLSNQRAQRENGKILKDHNQGSLIGGAGEVIGDKEQNPYLAATILDMSSSTSRSEGYLLGSEILKKLAGFTRIHKKQPIHASLAVLKSPDIPSLLIETGFLSNRAEEKQLSQAKYQQQIAYNIFKGIENYYEKYPAKNRQSRIESARRSQQRARFKEIVVSRGQSLSSIAREHGTSVTELKRTNSLTSDVLQPGQKLYLRQ